MAREARIGPRQGGVVNVTHVVVAVPSVLAAAAETQVYPRDLGRLDTPYSVCNPYLPSPILMVPSR